MMPGPFTEDNTRFLLVQGRLALSKAVRGLWTGFWMKTNDVLASANEHIDNYTALLKSLEN